MDEKKKKWKKSADIYAPPATAEAVAIIEKPEPPPVKLEPEKPKPGRLVRVNPGRLDRIRG